MIVCLISSTAWAGDTLYILCLDVGQGDATLIISPTGQTMLVDAGNNGKGVDEVLPFLNNLNIASLDYIVATHYHADHVGGIDEVVDSLSIDSIGVVYDRGWSYTTNTYYDYADAVASKRVAIEDSQVIDLGGGVEVTCAAVNGNGVLDTPFTDPPHSENDLCVALKLRYQSFEFFVAGDLSGETKGDYTDIETSVASEVGGIEVLRVNHHGSKYSSNEYFLDSLQPEVAIISVGENPYGHPHQETLETLENYDIKVLRTDIDGDIEIISNGLSYEIK